MANYQELKESIEAICELNSLIGTWCARNGSHQSGVRLKMIEMRRKQLSFGDGLIAEQVSDLREGWLQDADKVLAGEDVVSIVYDVLGRRHPESRSRGRRGGPAETVLRLPALKQLPGFRMAPSPRAYFIVLLCSSPFGGGDASNWPPMEKRRRCGPRSGSRFPRRDKAALLVHEFRSTDDQQKEAIGGGQVMVDANSAALHSLQGPSPREVKQTGPRRLDTELKPREDHLHPLLSGARNSRRLPRTAGHRL